MQANPNQLASFSAVQELIERDLFRFMFDTSETQMVVFDGASLRMIAANDAFLASAGVDLRDLRKLTVADWLGAVDPGRLHKLLSQAAARRTGRLSFRLNLKPEDRTQTRVALHCSKGEKTSFVAFLAPVADAADRAALAEERLAVAIESLSDGFVLFDKEDRLVTSNETYREIYSESIDALVPGTKFEDILRHGLERNQYSLGFNTPEAWLSKRMEEHRSCNSTAEQRLRDGRWLQIVERQTSDGGRVGLRVDITRQKEQQNELRRLARTDELTGLLNRRGLTRKLQILASGLQEGECLAIFHIDLDRFKTVNDVYGHEAGDMLLKGTAKHLSNFQPQADAIARMGADEFLVAVHGTFDDNALLAVGKQLLEIVSRPHVYQHQKIQVGANIGISYITVHDKEEVEDHITASDIALSEARRTAGNAIVLFTPRMREEVVANIEIAKDIRRGLEAGEFSPFFQPQIDTASGKVIGFEALIRWRHPKKGMIPAYQFLDVAQRVGLTESLDNLVMDKSCEAVRVMQDWGLSPACVSINLSLAQISDPRILKRLQECLDKHGIEPDNIRVELLESTLLDDRASIIVQNVHKLIRAGFQVELDDFGTGHAAIATLRKFEVSRIKVDRSLVSKIDQDPELQVITSALIDLAKNLGIDALAEGVETADEQKKLWDMGCYVAQGYLHARPMPLREVHEWLIQRGDVPRACNDVPQVGQSANLALRCR